MNEIKGIYKNIQIDIKSDYVIRINENRTNINTLINNLLEDYFWKQDKETKLSKERFDKKIDFLIKYGRY